MSEETSVTEEPVETTAPAETVEETAPEHQEEETAASEDTPEEPEKPKRRSRAEERINALTRKNYETERQLAESQRQNAELQQHIQQTQQPQTPQNMPRLADFDYDEGRYQQAVTDWQQDQMRQMQEQQQTLMQQQAQQAEAVRTQQLIQDKVAKGMAKHADFQAKVMDPSLPPLHQVNQAAFQAIVESDVGEDVYYYLANNQAELYALASMNPVQAIRTVAQIENKLQAKPVASNAPPAPPTRVGGKTEVQKDPDQMTTEEWMVWRNNELKAKQR